ncbi:uncharacterized protein [Chiloscyllium punctatum]|uniref:uncharacterized protein isoform X2 n=1 Tax=Chiloscyllium punctatum TaxID=137246 RepID=UPI003B63BB57
MLTVQDVAPLYQTDFVRNARAVAALWAVCTLCLALVEVVVLTEPGWVQAPGSGLAPPRLLRPLPAVPADRGAAPVPGLSGRPRPGALLPDPGWIRGRRPGPGPGQHLPRPGPSPLLQPGHRLQGVRLAPVLSRQLPDPGMCDLPGQLGGAGGASALRVAGRELRAGLLQRPLGLRPSGAWGPGRPRPVRPGLHPRQSAREPRPGDTREKGH